MPADHEMHGTVSVQPGTAADHAIQLAQLDAQMAIALARANHTGFQPVATLSDFQAAVDARVQLIVNAAPGALDTLNELAEALGDDPNFAATINASIGALDGRLDVLEAQPAGVTPHKATIGDGIVSTFTLSHNFGLANPLDVEVTVRRVSDGQEVYPVNKAASANTITLDFGSFVPGVASHRALCRPV